MVNLCLEGKFAEARPTHEKMIPVIQSLFAEGSPSGVKAYLGELGVVKDTFRLPVVGVSTQHKETIKAIMMGL